jgi:hypothetical protein
MGCVTLPSPPSTSSVQNAHAAAKRPIAVHQTPLVAELYPRRHRAAGESPIVHGTSMGPVSDGTTRLTLRQAEVCRLCRERPRSVDDMAAALGLAGGGSLASTVSRLAHRGAIVQAGHGQPRGTRKHGARLWALSEEWVPKLDMAPTAPTEGRISAGTELVIVPTEALAAAAQAIADTEASFPWAARLADSTFALLIAAEPSEGSGAVDRLLVLLAQHATKSLRIACGPPRPPRAVLDELAGDSAQLALPPATP